MATKETKILFEFINPDGKHNGLKIDLKNVETYDQFLQFCTEFVEDQHQIKEIYYIDSNDQKEEVIISTATEYKSFISQNINLLKVFIEIECNKLTLSQRRMYI